MSTITENINLLMSIKSDLNDVLESQDIIGGRDFTTYPEKFRSLFRVLEESISDITEGPDYDDEEDEIITSVEKPEISWNENVVTLSCITPGADIYYYTLSDNYSKGWTKYNKAFYISEDTYVECYSIYNEIRSATPNNWANIPYIGEITPDCPVITRNENTNTVTITCATSGATIWYKINKSGSWIEYTGQISVSNHDDVYSYATNRRRASDIVKNDAPDPILIPDVPEISCSANIVTITCDTEGASIWYRQYNSSDWVQYTGEFMISADVTLVAKSILDGVASDESDPYLCEYVAPVIPDAPVITESYNVVTITCATEGAAIYYKIDSGSWILYTGQIQITADCVITSYAILNMIQSQESSFNATYDSSYDLVAPTINCFWNLVTITCSTQDSIIYYSIDNGQYTLYTESFYINNSCVVNTYSYLNGESSQIINRSCTYSTPAVPDIDFTENTITLTCSTRTIDVSIYYSVNNGEYTLYTGPILVSNTIYLQAYSEIRGGFRSAVASGTYSFDINNITFTEGEDWTVDSNYANMPLTFELKENGYIDFNYGKLRQYDSYLLGTRLDYNLNNTGWKTVNDNFTVIVEQVDSYSKDKVHYRLNLNNGDIIQFRTNTDKYLVGSDNTYYNINFNMQARCDIYGNMFSLEYKDTYASKYLNTYLFKDKIRYLFAESFIVSARNLVLPSHLGDAGYMFNNCVYLKYAPKLSHITGYTSGGSYNCSFNYMFAGCSLLEYIPEMQDNISTYGMFGGCVSLANINYNYNISNKDSRSMFYNIPFRYMKISRGSVVSGYSNYGKCYNLLQLNAGNENGAICFINSSLNIDSNNLGAGANWSFEYI